jgi:hypothetical protein
MSVAVNGEIAALTICCAGDSGAADSSVSLTPKNSCRVRTLSPSRFTRTEILW